MTVPGSINPFTAMLAQFFGFGVAAGMWSGSIAFISSAAGMTTADLGFAFTLFTIAYIAAMSVGGVLLGSVSSRRLMLLCLPSNVIVLTGFLTATSSVGIMLWLIGIGFVMGLLDLVMNAEGTFLEADLNRPILSRLHCFASLGTATGAVAGSGLLLTAGPMTAAGLVGITLAIALYAVAAATPERQIRPRTQGGLRAAFSPALLVFGIIFGISSVGETSAQIWSARLLAAQAPDLMIIAGIGVTFFAGFQALMRFFGDRLRRAIGDERLMPVSLAIALTGFVIVGSSDGLTTSVTGFALVGIGTAMQVPCIFAIAVRRFPESGGAALSMIAAVAGIPRLLAPWGFGQIASQWSASIAFEAVAALFLLAFSLAIANLMRPPVLA